MFKFANSLCHVCEGHGSMSPEYVLKYQLLGVRNQLYQKVFVAGSVALTDHLDCRDILSKIGSAEYHLKLPLSRASISSLGRR